MRIRATTLCAAVNLSLVVLVWGAFVILAHALAESWWATGLLALPCLVMAGYIVQYGASPLVNRFVKTWFQ